MQGADGLGFHGRLRLLVSVDRLRVEGALVIDKVECAGVARNDLAVETRATSGVAGARALLDDVHQQDVLVTIGADLLHDLGVTRSGALVPDFLPTARIVDCLSDAQSLLERLLVHPGQHQGLRGGGVQGQGWNEAVRIKLGTEGTGLIDGRLLFAGGEADGFLITHGRETGGARQKAEG